MAIDEDLPQAPPDPEQTEADQWNNYDAEEAVATLITLFMKAIDPTGGILIPNAVVAWLPPVTPKDVLDGLLRVPLADSLRRFAFKYSNRPARSVIAFSSPDRLATPVGHEDIERALRPMARRMVFDDPRAPDLMLQAMEGNGRDLKLLISPTARIRPLRVVEISDAERQRLGLDGPETADGEGAADGQDPE
jgi:hypothetical protein